jgi:benzoate/toluate 1,2-dioxygenase reductase subunit
MSPLRATELVEVSLTRRTWLAAETFEVRFGRPAGFDFIPGQKVKLVHNRIERCYSLVSTPQEGELAICVRHIPNGQMTPVLAKAPIGQAFHLTPPFGFFVFQPSPRRAVFVASGTGIAPFVAFVRTGIRGFRLLHGVRHGEELYYQDILAPAACTYIACLSSARDPLRGSPHIFHGRVTAYIEKKLPLADYDFYLCGGSEMIRDVMGIVDDRFPAARVFTEIFY